MRYIICFTNLLLYYFFHNLKLFINFSFVLIYRMEYLLNFLNEQYYTQLNFLHQVQNYHLNEFINTFTNLLLEPQGEALNKVYQIFNNYIFKFIIYCYHNLYIMSSFSLTLVFQRYSLIRHKLSYFQIDQNYSLLLILSSKLPLSQLLYLESFQEPHELSTHLEIFHHYPINIYNKEFKYCVDFHMQQFELTILCKHHLSVIYYFSCNNHQLNIDILDYQTHQVRYQNYLNSINLQYLKMDISRYSNSFNELDLGFPIFLFLCAICLCIFVIYILSPSNNPIVPTPAVPKQIPNGHPIPPHPIIAILVFIIFRCPSYLIYGSSICREYLQIRNFGNYGVKLVSNRFYKFCNAKEISEKEYYEPKADFTNIEYIH